jgi:hypothetical protein
VPELFHNPSDEEIRALLERSRIIALVGLSPRPERDSNRIARYLIEQGYRVLGVRPGYEEILGRPCYPKLADVPEKIDLVNVFRRPVFVPGHAAEAVSAGAGALWLQLGVIHQQAALAAKHAGMTVVMDRCIMVEHDRLLGG